MNYRGAASRLPALGLAVLLAACSAPRPPAAIGFYVGGSDVDDCDDVAAEAGGVLYLACHSTSADFPGAEAKPASNGMDGYVVRVETPAGGLSTTGARLGGSGWDAVVRVGVAPSGAVWAVGFTESNDFPTTPDALQPRFRGGKSDAFLARLSPSLEVEYVTLLGGSDTEQAGALAFAPDGTVYLAGTSWSADFPLAEPRSGSDADIFILAFHPDRPQDARAVRVGGSSYEKATAIAYRDGTLYVAGFTRSADFPALRAFQAELPGALSAFLVAIDAARLTPVWATYFGGAGEDAAWGLAVDAEGHPWLCGSTSSADLPAVRALQPRYGGAGDAFLARFSPDGRELLFATYVGGSGEDSCGYDGSPLAIDARGRLWMAGITASPDLALRDASQPAFGGDTDGFVLQLSPEPPELLFATYAGGSGRDLLEGLTVTPAGEVWAVGLTGSRDLPFRAASARPYAGGMFDAMLLRFDRRDRPSR